MIAKNHIYVYNYPIFFLIEEYNRAYQIAEQQRWTDATIDQFVLSSANSTKGFKAFKNEVDKRVKEWKNQ